MNQNNQSLVKHLVESPELRKWARKTIVTKGGNKKDALATHLKAAYLLWERLDMGMEIQQPEAYVRTVMIKTWKDMAYRGQTEEGDVQNTAGNPMNAFHSDNYGSDAETVVMKRTQMKEEKVAKIASWNEVIVRREKRRRQMIIGSVIVLISALAGAAYWFFVMVNG